MSPALAIEILLRPKLGAVESRKAASGWDGDRYRVYGAEEQAQDATLLVWVSTWDTEDDAEEFASALITAYVPPDAQFARADVPKPERLWVSDDGLSGIWRDGADVFFLDRVPPESFTKLVPWSRSLTRAVKSLAGLSSSARWLMPRTSSR